MTLDGERLRRVLDLERARGFPDSAVIGGLDRMLRALLDSGQLIPGSPTHDALATLPARGYASLSPAEREQWARLVLRDLDRAARSAVRPSPAARSPELAAPRPGNADYAPPSTPVARPKPLAPEQRAAARSSTLSEAKLPGTLHRPPSRPTLPPHAERVAPAIAPAPFHSADPAPRPAARTSAPASAAPTSVDAPTPAKPVTKASTTRAAGKRDPAGLDASVTTLPYVSGATAGKLARLGIHVIRDLLWHLPFRYDDYSQTRKVADLLPGEEQTVIATVWSASETTIGRFRKATEAVLGDETGNLRVVWFNQPWLAKQLPTNALVALSGRVTVFQGVRQMESPEWELIEGDLSDSLHTGRLVPVYPLTAGLPARTVRRLARRALDLYLPLVSEPLPEEARERQGLLPLPDALAAVHFPDNAQMAQDGRARLAFEELLTLQLAVLRRRGERATPGSAPALPLDPALRSAFLDSLPFAPTEAQTRVIGEIAHDLARPTPMARLVQGDVGSGKTVVAAAALLACVAGGRQGALMAPTEILAEQHFRTLCRLFGSEAGEAAIQECRPPYLDRPLRIGLLRGGLGARAKAASQRAMAAGEIDIAVGTQALIQTGVTLPKLGLAIVDEQHRFGVAQRAALRGDEGAAHLLVMTATPIPRSLALTLYGDLDVSVIDQMPPGRKPVKTLVVQSHERDAAYSFIIEQLRAGRQAFVICPLVEESEVLEARAATAEYERLRDVFTSATLALRHGRMTAAQKDEVMRAFRNGLHDVLVSTAVVEVGIDVPNATVMLIEGAERFGLAQLHQFRGRVGRGQHQSYCFLMADGVSEEARERLRLMEEIGDGFRLAEEDLRLRKEGDILGTRQSGEALLKVASLRDIELVERARAEALAALGDSASLADTPLAAYAATVERIVSGAGGDVS